MTLDFEHALMEFIKVTYSNGVSKEAHDKFIGLTLETDGELFEKLMKHYHMIRAVEDIYYIGD